MVWVMAMLASSTVCRHFATDNKGYHSMMAWPTQDWVPRERLPRRISVNDSTPASCEVNAAVNARIANDKRNIRRGVLMLVIVNAHPGPGTVVRTETGMKLADIAEQKDRWNRFPRRGHSESERVRAGYGI